MEFDINPRVVKNCISDFNSIRQEINKAKDGIHNVAENISMQLTSAAEIRGSLYRQQDVIESLIEKLAALENGLEIAVDLYLKCERGILNQAEVIANTDSGRTGLRGWWENIREWFSTGVWNDPDKAARVKRDKAMADELHQLIKSERFSKETWKNSSTEERKQILRELFEKMQAIYGIALTGIEFMSIEAEPGYITYGYYTSNYNTICINEDLLADSGNYNTIMDTMAHEMRHGYQQAVVDNPEAFQVDQDTVTEWRNNINDYKTLEDDGFEEYWRQPIEEDARKFAGWVI